MMKLKNTKWLSVLLAILMLCGMATPTLAVGDIVLDSGVTALESGKVYTVSTRAELENLAKLINGVETPVTGYTVKMLNDIDLLSVEWTPIGTYTDSKVNRPFSGTFDGGGFEVKNLLITSASADYQGLFCAVGADGIVQNLGVSGSVSGFDYVAAVVSYNMGLVQNCYSSATVSGNEHIGGVVGNYNKTIKNCYNTGTVIGARMVGGVAGSGYTSTTIQNCYNTGTVSGNYEVGGVVGRSYNYVKDCISLGPIVNRISGEKGRFGRVVGQSQSTNPNPLQNNKARSDMLVIAAPISGGTGADINGADTPLDTALSDVFSGWDSGIWEIPGGNLAIGSALPSLKGFSAVKSPTLPEIKPPNTVLDSSVTALESGKVYTVSTRAELENLTKLVNGTETTVAGYTVKLLNNIDLSGGKWTPIGIYESVDKDRAFSGTFDGGGFEVKNISIDDKRALGKGFFANIGKGGTVKNLCVSGEISADNPVGGVASKNNGTVQNCVNSVTVNGRIAVGGVVGSNSGNITNCYNTAEINTTNYAGGIAGTNWGTVDACYNIGMVRGALNVGGIVGENNGDVQRCVSLNYSVGRTQEGYPEFGRIVGSNVSGTLSTNKARSDMLLLGATVSGGTEADINGADTPLDTALSDVFESWSGSIWDIPSGNLAIGSALPSLKGFSAVQSPTLPSKTDISSKIIFEDDILFYDGTAQTFESAYIPNTNVKFNYTYAADTGKLDGGKPKNVGSYTVTATVEDAVYIGSKTATLTIDKMTLYIKADDKSIEAGAAKPTYTATAEWLAGDETLSDVTFSDDAADTKTAGSYTITPAGGKISGGNENYDIYYETGVLTITAYPSTGGGGSTGGGSITPPKPEPPIIAPDTGDATIVVSIKPENKGTVSSASVGDQTVSSAANLAAARAAKTGGKAEVIFEVNAPKGATSSEFKLSSGSLREIAGKTDGLKISGGIVDFSFDKEALAKIASESGSEVKITAAQVENKNLSAAQREKVGDAPVFDFTVTSGVRTISEFGGTVSVSIPYTPKDGENTDFITIWLLTDDGKLEPITAKYADGKITFETSHFSRYAIGYLPFGDLENDWSYDSIVYAYNNNLFGGIYEGIFAPKDGMTRAMFWTVLARMDGKDVTGGAVWYEKAQAWAVESGLSDGTNPDDAITREQFAATLWRFAKLKGYDVSVGEDTNILSYNDFDQISAYAIPALQWACGADVIDGDGELLSPKANATRAQVATMLTRFCTIVAK